MAVALDLHVLADRDRPRPRDPAQVVAAEIDQHHVLRALLRIALELLGQERVLLRVGAARARAGDRVGREPVALDLEEQFRRGADDLEGRRPDEEQVGARVDPAEGPIQADAVEGSRRSPGRPGARTTGGGRGRPGSPRRRRSRPWRPRRHGCTRRARGWCRSRAPSPARPLGGIRRRPTVATAVPPSRRRWVATSVRAPRRSPPRRSGSDPRGPARPCAARRSPTGCGSGDRRRARGRSR